MCAQAMSEPVFIEKDGRVDPVVVSFEQFVALKDAHNEESAAQRRRDFNRTCKAWIDEIDQDFVANGLWCDGVRMW